MKRYRIFLMIDGAGSSSSADKMWVRNLYDPLVELGHDVTLFDIGDFARQHGQPSSLTRRARETLSERFSAIFREYHAGKGCDIFFSYLHSGQIRPEVIAELDRTVYKINYTTNFHQFDLYREIARHFDLNIHITRAAGDAFHGIGANAYWMPLAGNPHFYRPQPVGKTDEIAFIGSNYGVRAYYLWRVLQHGLNLQIYGTGWDIRSRSLTKRITKKLRLLEFAMKSLVTSDAPFLLNTVKSTEYELILRLMNRDYSGNIHGFLTDEEYVRKLSSAAIVLNISEVRINNDYMNPNLLKGDNLRDFEATLCGSFLCTRHYEDLPHHFVIDREVCSFHNEEDLVDKLGYYACHPDERERIARAGYERALRDHTWRVRFEKLFARIASEV